MPRLILVRIEQNGDVLIPHTNLERFSALDVLRGFALFGVLMVNILTFFRVSLFQHLLTLHTHSGAANYYTDLFAAGCLDFKAFTLFSLLFGIGICIQVERTTGRNVNTSKFLLRRFVVLLGFGLFHMFIISNSDILCLYAICGLILIPAAQLQSRTLIAIAIPTTALSFAPIYGSIFPSETEMHADATTAAHIYATGNFLDIFKFRWTETLHFIGPLLINCLPKTLGLMLLGIATWRSKILQQPNHYRRFLWATAIGCGVIGTSATAYLMFPASSASRAPLLRAIIEAFSYLPLAFSYAAGILIWISSTGDTRLKQMVAAGGQMALTNYLAQSVIFGLIFYSYGFGLFGRLGSAAVALIGIVVYVAQLAFSRAWLRHFEFGPFRMALALFDLWAATANDSNSMMRNLKSSRH